MEEELKAGAERVEEEEQVTELTEADLDSVSGGVPHASIKGESLIISWSDGDKMNDIWSLLNGFKTVLSDWDISIDDVKSRIKSRAHEKLGAQLRYWATTSDKVTISPNGIN